MHSVPICLSDSVESKSVSLWKITPAFARRRSNWCPPLMVKARSCSSFLTQTTSAWLLFTCVPQRSEMPSQRHFSTTRTLRVMVHLTHTSSARDLSRNYQLASVVWTLVSTRCKSWRTTERTSIPVSSLSNPFSLTAIRAGPRNPSSSHWELSL